MKISLAWILDYIDIPFAKVDVDKIVHLFNTRVAEIEHYEKFSCDFKKTYVVKVLKSSSKNIVVYCSELAQDIDLPARSDAVEGKYYLVSQDKKVWSWLDLATISAEKEGLFPAVDCTDALAKGSWRKLVESQDYILDVDNKSINHRPDLWGHYGIAREVAAFLHVKLKPLEKVLQKQSVVAFDKTSKRDKKHSFSIKINDSDGCSRFAGLHCKQVEHKDSDLFMAMRLLKVGSKPINMVVDLTNYVMFDVGHPMHVFDAASFDKQEVVVRKAKKGEKLTILDGQELTLSSQDLVVADEMHPVALAGIMGGKGSGFSDKTKELFLEAAGFDPTMIRKTAQRFKLRTEASARFEKHLDPMQNVTVLQRFLYLAHEYKVFDKVAESIVSVGKVIKPMMCKITHEQLETKIGAQIKESFVKDILERLGFGVQVAQGKAKTEYGITVPTTRMTKDIQIQEDIVEEVVRMYGFENIDYQLPLREAKPFDAHVVRNISAIKRYLAFSCKMHEIRDYLFYDESFLRRLSYEPTKTISVKNPVSENWTQLVTSLVPHLLKNVELNFVQKSSIRLFELNSVWTTSSKKHSEHKSLAGIMFHKQGVDFYDAKAELQGLWDLLGIEVVFKKPKKDLAVWYDQHKSAELFVEKTCIGTAGMMSEKFLKSVVDGQAFVFELDADFLADIIPVHNRFKAWSKYQNVFYDISMLVPLKVSSDQLKESIMQAHDTICSVELVDFFEKDDWNDRRSLTFRYQMSDETKTLDKQDMEVVMQAVQKAVEKYDVQVR